MQKSRRKRTNQELDNTRVKMYKTHHGWVSCLTRFFHLLSFNGKEEVRAEQFVDKDSIKEQRAMSTSAYLKGLGLLTTMLGVGGVASATPTAVHAADVSADTGSQVVGSISTTGSTSNAQSNSLSTSVRSNSMSQSNSFNSGSTTTSMSNNVSASASGVNSTSGSHASTTSSTSNNSESTTATSTATRLDQGVATVAQTAGGTPSVINAQFMGLAAVNLVANSNTTTVNNSSEFMLAINNSSISVINLAGDLDLSGQGIINIARNLTINAHGHNIWLTGANSQFKMNTTGISLNINDANIYFSGRGSTLTGSNGAYNGAILLRYNNQTLTLNNV